MSRWRAGAASWSDLRLLAEGEAGAFGAKGMQVPPAPRFLPAGGIWQAGGLRVIHLGSGVGVRRLAAAKAAVGHLRILHDLALGSGVQALAVDQVGLALLLEGGLGGRLLLDRCGTPALDQSRPLVGIPPLEEVPWRLGRDWSATVAILDSGCDTAHGDLGDPPDDDIDGPPPAVGDAGDWLSATNGWPLSQGLKVVGWHDVTDDFPLAAGPWDYHYHGTALASVVAGSGNIEARYRGIVPSGRLTVVKFYDFDGQWRMWAGDFLAACQWTVEHAALYRIRAALCAVNWSQDLGISDAMTALIAAGIVPVVAMGNQGNDPAGPGFPARLPQVLTVGAVTDQGAVAAYSGRGTPEYPKPDLLAPGGGLLPAGGRITAADNEPNDSYSPRVGTSLAAAHVAGAVYMLGEALKDAGVVLPPDSSSVLTLRAVLEASCAPVGEAETADGSGLLDLGPQAGADNVRGWGLLRIDGAVQALRLPLAPGQTDADTLGPETPVMARRLITVPGGRYVLKASPEAGLDVGLVVLTPDWLLDDPRGSTIPRADERGVGGAETLAFEADNQWTMAVVKVLGGAGTVTLSLQAEESAEPSGVVFSLPGVATGPPNVARLGSTSDVSLVLPSRVTVGPEVRALNVTDRLGRARPGWPAFLFPNPSSQGGLTQALAWNLDGLPGDEIVVASDYGSVYFFAGDGTYQEVLLTLNLPLGTPVGLTAADGRRLVAVADQAGVIRTWEAGGVLRGERDLGHSHPLSPAAGSLITGGDEALVIACGDGFITALDGDLKDLPGWPRFLAHNLSLPPVLLDRDGDGQLEVVVPVWAGSGDDLVLRVFRGDGEPAAADGSVLAPGTGGKWLALSPPVVGGGYAQGGLTVELVGLMDNGQVNDQTRWYLGAARLDPGGIPVVETMAGFQVAATARQSILTLDDVLLPAPLSYADSSDRGNEPVALVHLRWQDLLYGLSTMPGATTAWLRTGPDLQPLAAREPVDVGGEDAPPVTCLASMLILDRGQLSRVRVRDEQVAILPLPGLQAAFPYWLSARGDGRNSGAAPLAGSPSPVPVSSGNTAALRAFPNPASGRVFFRLRGSSATATARLEVFDLRGRRILRRELPPEQGGWLWDGRIGDGGPLAAGVYLATIVQGSRRAVTRLTVTR